MEFWKGYNGQQSGDPAKLAQALITISAQERRLAVSSQGQMLSAQQNRWQKPFSSRPMPTVSCHRPSHTITRKQSTVLAPKEGPANEL